ncbi:MAG: hypothetical protein HLX50_14630 [Alteromonadaceae bacterium]|nr:hypothetical protein [Alteromonadaceae bacterium]
MAFTKGTANFTNGSKAVTSVSLTSGQLAYFGSGTAVFVQSEGQLIEATGLPKDGNGDVIPNQFLLRNNWAGSTGSYTFVAFDTIEGLRDAVQSARGFSEQLQDVLSSLSVNPAVSSIVKRTAQGRVKTADASADDDAVPLGQTGTAFDKDVQTNATDSTADRLMAVGAFGLGSHTAPVLANASLTVPRVTGFYRYASNCTDKPDSNNGFLLVNSRSTTTYTITAISDSNRVYIYTVINDTVLSGGWVTLYHTNNILGTVSQSSGVPTGAIIEHDSNSDGEYIKFADGTLLVHRSIVPDVTSTGTQTFMWPVNGLSDRTTMSGSYCTNSGSPNSALYNTNIRAFSVYYGGGSGWTLQLETAGAEGVAGATTENVQLFGKGRWYN